MIALDTNALQLYLNRKSHVDSARVARVIESGNAILPPVVLAEVMSEPTIDEQAAEFAISLPLLIGDGYWFRAGRLRGILLQNGFKAQMPDCLIAQSCIDNEVPLITYDRDFRRFVPAGLKLVIEEV